MLNKPANTTLYTCKVRRRDVVPPVCVYGSHNNYLEALCGNVSLTGLLYMSKDNGNN